MKLKILLACSAFLFGMQLQSQETATAPEEFKPSGKATGKIFWNFNYDMSEDAKQTSAFEIQRAYFGYNYNFSENVKAVVLLDGAKKSEASEYTVFVKNAMLDYKVNKTVRLQGGIIGLKHVDTQEKFYGYRYLVKNFQDEFALGTTADLGVNGEFTLSPKLTANVFILNGEGFAKLQDELGTLKYGGNLIYQPIEGLTIKGYYDIFGGKAYANDTVINSDTSYVQSFDLWVGYATPKFRIGAEVDYQINGKDYRTIAADHDILALAFTAAYTINKKFEAFGMLYSFQSNTLEGATSSWAYGKDGNLVIAGLQYAPIKGVKCALNYKTFLFDNTVKTTQSGIFANFEISF